MIVYLLKVSLVLGVLLLCFWGLFRGDKWFRFNRYYLLLSILIAFVFTLFDWHFYWGPSYNIQEAFMSTLEHGTGGELVDEPSPVIGKVVDNTSFYELFWQTLFGIATIVSALFFVRFINNLWTVKKEISKGIHLDYNGLKLVLTKARIDPYSFLNFIVVNQQEYDAGLIDQEIITHEETHCRQYHTLDIMFIELLLIAFWWHPLLWVYKHFIKVNHEYLADRQVVSTSTNAKEYAHKILMANSMAQTHLPVNFFNLSLTKNRIFMLTKKNKSSIFLLSSKALASVVVAFVTFTLLAFDNGPKAGYSSDSQGEFVVLIDPGHGAQDPGATHGELTEKTITLQIAKRLQQNKNLKNVKLIFTRQDDQFVSLKERTGLSNNEEVDLLLSIHVNSSGDSGQNGTEIYFNPNTDYSQKSLDYGQVLADELSHRNARLIMTEGMYVLRESKCPSIMLEAGFLSNNNDRKVLTNSKTLNKIADDISKALVTMSQL